MSRTGLTMAILSAFVGLMMLAAPSAFIQATVILLGICELVNGILNLAVTRNLIVDPGFRLDMTIRGWTSILVGILSIALPLAFAEAMWTIMLYTLGVFLVFSAGMEIYAAVKLHGAGMPCSQYVWEIVISLLVAAVLFVMPASVGVWVIRIGGGLVILSSVCLFIYVFKTRTTVIEPDSVEDDTGSTDTH